MEVEVRRRVASLEGWERAPALVPQMNETAQSFLGRDGVGANLIYLRGRRKAG